MVDTTQNRPMTAEEQRLAQRFQQQVELSAAAERERVSGNVSIDDIGVETVPDDTPPGESAPDNVTPIPQRPTLVKKPIEDFLDLDDRDEELGGRTVKIDGNEIQIQPIKVGASRKMGWYQARVNDLTNKLNAETNEDRAMKLEDELRKFQEKMTVALIPGFPLGILDSLSMGKYRRLMEYVNRIIEEDMGDESPNA